MKTVILTLALNQKCKYQSFGNPSRMCVVKGLLICLNKASFDKIKERWLKRGRRQLFMVIFNTEI